MSDTALMDPANLPLPPAAPGLPFIGNFLEGSNEQIPFVTDMAATLGPIFRAKFFHRGATIVSGPQVAQLEERAEAFGLSRHDTFWFFDTYVGVDAFLLEGDAHTQRRKQLSLAWSKGLAGQFVPELVETVREVSADWKPGSRQKMLDVTSRIVVRAICRLLSPALTEDITRDSLVLGDRVLWVLSSLRPALILRAPAFKNATKRVAATIGRAARHHASGGVDDPRTYMLDAFLDGRRGNNMSVEEATNHAIFTLAVGGGYLSRVTTMMLYHLLFQPGARERVLAEVDEAFAEGLPTPEMFRRMHFLRATYMEALRLHPLVPGGIYNATRDFGLLGHRVPKGDIVVFSYAPAHYDDTKWAAPRDFRAEHWTTDRPRCPLSERFTPYGRGRRSCISRGLNEVMVFTLVATMMRDFKFRLIRPSYRPTIVPNPLTGPKCRLPVIYEGVRAEDEHANDGDALASVALPIIDDETLPTVADAERTIVEPGQVVVNVGDVADRYYVVVAGTARVDRPGPDGLERLATLGPGEGFGELGILGAKGRTAAVTAVTTLELLSLTRAQFLHYVEVDDLDAQDMARGLWLDEVERVLLEALPTLRPVMVKTLAAVARRRTFATGDAIVQQGAPPSAVHVLFDGRATVTVEGPEGSEVVAGLTAPAVVGELGVLHQRPRTATVRAVDGDVGTFEIPGDALRAVVEQGGTGMRATAASRLFEIVEAFQNQRERRS